MFSHSTGDNHETFPAGKVHFRFSRLVGALFTIAVIDGLAMEATMEIVPTVPPSMAVRVGSEELRFDPPDVERFQALTRDGSLPEAPKNHAGEHDRKLLWPDALRLTPLYDPTRTHILGALFRTFHPESLRVTAEDGLPYQRDVDFVYQEDWGLIANKDGRMSGRIHAMATGVLQRIDLIQRDAKGRLSVKRGPSVWVCPEIPAPDPGQERVAGIYIAPWRTDRNPHFTEPGDVPAGASEYAITSFEIFPIRSIKHIPALHPEHIEKVRTKLRRGDPVKVAFLGDSITLGAESTRWWNDAYDEHSLTWKGRVIHGLRQRFPKAKIEVIEAYQGGVTVAFGQEKIAGVLERAPDLVVIAFGVNDADSDIGGRPKTDVGEFRRTLANLAEASRQAGADVLFVTPFPITPWLANGHAQRLEEIYVPAIRETATANKAAVADVHEAYKNLDAEGIPWVSQNHNWINHPGNLGHKIYADTVLACFPEADSKK